MTAFSSSLPHNSAAGWLPGPVPLAQTGQGLPLEDAMELRLIRRAQAGDTGAFRTLVERHQEIIHRLCLRWLSCGEDASEVCQDTFLRAWQALPAWEPKGKLTTWLYRIALNLCRDRARSKASRQRERTVSLSALPSSPSCPLAPPDMAASHTGDMEKLGQGMAMLPESLRVPLVLCAMEGLSYQEAAEVLRCSPRAIEGRLYRARQMLLHWWNQNP